MEYKPDLVFCGPVTTVSGYGSHARDLVLSLIEMDTFEIKIISINWGETPMNALDENDKDHKKILDRIMKTPMTTSPDIWMQCTIPAEFQAVGKYNIGITAGIETDICSPEWIDGCNKMNMIIVPSKHAKDVFEKTEYEKKDKASDAVIDMLKVTKPIYVLHEGVRTDIYNKTNELATSIKETLDSVKEDFAFLFVGHWLKGDFGQDRKDLSGLIYTFLNTFADTKNAPALILKTSSGTFSQTGKSHIMDKINTIKTMVKKESLPNIYLLHGDLTDDEMNSLYNHEKVKSFVSFTKGEGYGRPLAEFMASGKPMLVSGWSGHLDFVDSAKHVLLKGSVTPVHKSAVWNTIINEGSSWFSVDYKHASDEMRKVFTNYNKHLTISKLSSMDVKTKWSYDAMKKRFKELLGEHLPKFAPVVKLNLPKMKKVGE
jgi:glycosyltransferase involved in cell wall biosynthesis